MNKNILKTTSVGKVKQYYILLRRVYKIISLELKGVSKKLIL